MTCKICNNKTYVLYDKQFDVNYHRCTGCSFIYEDPKHHLTENDEKIAYDSHNNSIEDEGYVNMFKRFQDAFKPFVSGKTVLEYGSGPEPVFSELLRRDGFDVTSYDPYYLPDDGYLEKTYDMITSTEVFEHFVEPMIEIKKLVGLLKSDGILAIMTQFPKEDKHFLDWWYRRDLTHIAFYSVESFESISKILDLEILYHNNKDYMILKKI